MPQTPLNDQSPMPFGKTRIYVLMCPMGIVRYVGKTVKTLKQRLAEHLRSAKRGGSTHRERWIRSLLDLGLKPAIFLVEEVDGDGCFEEIKWISYYRKVELSLVNATNGGEGIVGLIFTPSHRAKISKALTGLKRPESTKALIRIARAKQPPAHTTPHSEETKQKIREKLSDPEIRAAIGRANAGKPPVKKGMKRI